MIEVQNASRSKCSMVPYSKDISETVLLDSVIFCNVHIFFIELSSFEAYQALPNKIFSQKKFTNFLNFELVAQYSI